MHPLGSMSDELGYSIFFGVLLLKLGYPHKAQGLYFTNANITKSLEIHFSEFSITNQFIKFYSVSFFVHFFLFPSVS